MRLAVFRRCCNYASLRHGMRVDLFAAHVMREFDGQGAAEGAREVSMPFATPLGGGLLDEADRGLCLVGAVCLALSVVALAAR